MILLSRVKNSHDFLYMGAGLMGLTHFYPQSLKFTHLFYIYMAAGFYSKCSYLPLCLTLYDSTKKGFIEEIVT